MKTADLEGARLDYWVAKAQGLAVAIEYQVTCPRRLTAVWIEQDGKRIDYQADHYSPSTNWAQAGPIIEAEKIDLIHYGEDGYKGGLWEAVRRIHTHYIDQRPGDATGGPTPLIAAMRAFVAAKFGDEIAETPP